MALKMKNKGQVVVAAKQFIAGTTKHLAGVAQVTLLGGSLTPDQITSKLQALVDLRSGVDAAKATAMAKIANEAAQKPALLALMGALESFVKATFGSSPDVLADFGLAPKARAQVTVEAKAVAAAKRKATRAARHTMGPKQKKAITGVVPDALVIPTHASSPVVTTATAPSSPAAPATSVGSQATGAAATPRTV
jgi:hypothetical protein